MELLPPELRVRLPPLGSQAGEAEPIIYAHLFIPDFPNHWYIAEGSPVGDDFIFFCFHIGSELEEDWGCGKFTLSGLEALSRNWATVVRDLEFEAGRFTDVVPYPYLNEEFGPDT